MTVLCGRCGCHEDDHEPVAGEWERRNQTVCTDCNDCLEFVPPGVPVEDRCGVCGAVCDGWTCPRCDELLRAELRKLAEEADL